jgi:hypothetical protein
MPATNNALGHIEEAAVDDIDARATWFAVGDDASDVNPGDAQLGNEVFDDAVNSSSTTSDNVTKTGVVAASEANGETLREAAIKEGDAGEILQGDTFPDTAKTSDIELFVDFSLTFNATNS